MIWNSLPNSNILCVKMHLVPLAVNHKPTDLIMHPSNTFSMVIYAFPIHNYPSSCKPKLPINWTVLYPKSLKNLKTLAIPSSNHPIHYNTIQYHKYNTNITQI